LNDFDYDFDVIFVDFSFSFVFLFNSQGKKILLNESAGYLLRTKLSNVDDGGVAAGIAVLDTPFLIDE